ncbi:MAG: RecX family transcriptional regulator [Rhodospirillaceae bacterium]|nr:MAG: RecX family transcriptional regulator [Rhodospirillaceae bacterium]
MPRKSKPPTTSAPATRRQRPVARPMTERRLENIAIFYLQRFSTTAAHLRRVLTRRAERSIDPQSETRGASRAEARIWIDRLIARLTANGMLSDLAYAEGQARMLRQLGKSPGVIRAKLRTKGVEPATIDAVLDQTSLTADGGDATLRAALAYARRRKLGPFREIAADRAAHQKDLGTLARAGFSLDVARRVLAQAPDTPVDET